MGNTRSKSKSKSKSNICITESECKKVAKSLGLKLGGGRYAFSGNYGVKGLYAYKRGRYSGMSFFGKGGTVEQMTRPINHQNKYRPVRKLPKCNWIQKSSSCQRTSIRLKSKLYYERKYRQTILNQLYGVRREFYRVTKILSKEIKTYNKLMMMFRALKGVCFNSEDATKKSKLNLMKTLSGRYLDRINLLESQKNLLNKQGILLSEKLDIYTENKDTLEDLDDKLMTADRKTLLDLKGSRNNTKTIWLLKNSSYILAVILIYFILKKL